MMRTHVQRPPMRSAPDPMFGRSQSGSLVSPPIQASSAGHEFARVAVSAPGRPQAPIQRVRWTWDAANAKWSGPPGASHARQPPRPGTRDGQEYEDNR